MVGSLGSNEGIQGLSDRRCGWSWIAPISCVFRNCECSSSAIRGCPLAQLVTEKCPSDHGRFKCDLTTGRRVVRSGTLVGEWSGATVDL